MERDGSRGTGNHVASRDYGFLRIRLGLGRFAIGWKKRPSLPKLSRQSLPSRLMGSDVAGHSRETNMGTERCWWSMACG